MARHIALLRGINLGSRNRVPMPELRELLAAYGYEDPRTLVQSGNVVLSSRKPPATVQRDVERAIADALGFDVDVVVRTAGQLAETVAADPFADVRDDYKRHQVVFLGGSPDAAAIERLEATDFSPERLAVRAGELHAWCPAGVNDSPLLKALTKVRTTATARNWRTVEALVDLSSSP
jgi:uncharacterized protein (DUF1697 family)